jgi:hypothetical protein
MFALLRHSVSEAEIEALFPFGLAETECLHCNCKGNAETYQTATQLYFQTKLGSSKVLAESFSMYLDPLA